MKAVFGPLGRASTYRRLAYLLLGLPIGVFYFVFLVTALSVGVGLVIIWVGVFILLGAVIAWRAFGSFERGLASILLDRPIERPPSPFTPEMSWGRRARALVTDSYTWRSFAWVLVRFPLGIFGFVLVVTLVSVTFALLFTPAVLWFPEDLDADWVDRLPDALVWFVPVVGVLFGAVSAHAISGFGALHGLMAKLLLGPSGEQERAELQERTDVLEERTLLAHELHDSVGHTLTMMVVQAGAGGHVFERDPKFARQALENIEESGRRALGELDRILGIMREDGDGQRRPQPTLSRVPTLVDEMTAAGVQVSLIAEGPTDDLPPEVNRSGYRIVQEALTNVLKHAGPVLTEVRLIRTKEAVEIEVVNEAPVLVGAPGVVEPGTGGRGLIGIRERVAMLGGSVEAGPRPDGGYRVWARLPVGAVYP
ncbi:MAG: sensor domain-containing protein [Acidimicrobiia bacterium]